jgi:hypothetical protein
LNWLGVEKIDLFGALTTRKNCVIISSSVTIVPALLFKPNPPLY